MDYVGDGDRQPVVIVDWDTRTATATVYDAHTGEGHRRRTVMISMLQAHRPRRRNGRPATGSHRSASWRRRKAAGSSIEIVKAQA